jgi:hypothetical protein
MSGSQSSDKSLLRVSEYNVKQELEKKADFFLYIFRYAKVRALCRKRQKARTFNAVEYN